MSFVQSFYRISTCSKGKQGLNRRLNGGSKKVNCMNTALKELSFQ